MITGYVYFDHGTRGKSKLIDELVRTFSDEYKSFKPLNFVDTSEFLKKYGRRDFESTDFSKYSFDAHFGSAWSAFDDEKRYEEDYNYDGRFYGDTNYQFVLRQEGLYSAVLGITFPDRKSIMFPQIQGIKGRKKSLSPIHWQNALVNLGIEWARRSKMGIQRAMILPAERNTWVNSDNLDRLKMRYDETAKQEGFEYSKKLGVFVRKL